MSFVLRPSLLIPSLVASAFLLSARAEAMPAAHHAYQQQATAIWESQMQIAYRRAVDEMQSRLRRESELRHRAHDDDRVKAKTKIGRFLGWVKRNAKFAWKPRRTTGTGGRITSHIEGFESVRSVSFGGISTPAIGGEFRGNFNGLKEGSSSFNFGLR